MDHDFPQQIFPDSVGQFAKFCGSLQQIFHTQKLIFYGHLNVTKYVVFATNYRNWQWV